MADLERYYEERQKNFPFKPASYNSTSTLPRKSIAAKGQGQMSSSSRVDGQPRRPAQRPVKPLPPSSGVRENSGYLRSTKASASRAAAKRRVLMPKAMNASLEIWEIQRELKRGEMVQVSPKGSRVLFRSFG